MCNEVQYEFTGEPAVTALCHCKDFLRSSITTDQSRRHRLSEMERIGLHLQLGRA